MTALLNRELVVIPGNAVARYTVPMPNDSRIPGRNAEEVALNGSVLSTVKSGGPAHVDVQRRRSQLR